MAAQSISSGLRTHILQEQLLFSADRGLLRLEHARAVRRVGEPDTAAERAADWRPAADRAPAEPAASRRAAAERAAASPGEPGARAAR